MTCSNEKGKKKKSINCLQVWEMHSQWQQRHSFNHFTTRQSIDSIENLQQNGANVTNGAHVAKTENVKPANSTKICFSGFASSGSSLTEHHFIPSFLWAHVRLVFCFLVCLFASSEPPVSETVCPRARTPCSRAVSCSSRGISWEKKGSIVVTIVCKVWMVLFFRHVAHNRIYCINGTSTRTSEYGCKAWGGIKPNFWEFLMIKT